MWHFKKITWWITLFFAILFFLIACNKDEGTVQTGSIEGYDDYSVSLDIVQTKQHNIEMTSAKHTSNVYGNISNQFKDVVSGAKVAVLNPDGKESNLSTLSDFEGYYEIHHVPQGSRKIVFYGDKYRRYETAFDLDNKGYNLNVGLFEWGLPCADMPYVTYEGQVYNTVMIGKHLLIILEKMQAANSRQSPIGMSPMKEQTI